MAAIDRDKARNDPASVFDAPADLAVSKKLSIAEKARALQEWELEARLRDVAVEEGMVPRDSAADDERSALREVKRAQLALGIEPVKDDGTPTKL